MVSLQFIPPASLLFLVLMTGVSQQQHVCHTCYYPYVLHTHYSACAVWGSTVTLGCIYTYPFPCTFQIVYQSKEQTRQVHDLIPDHQYSGPVQHLTPYYCSPIILTGVTQQDQRPYNFMAPQFTFQVVHLSVTELQVDMVPDSVYEGDPVTLTCETTCRLTDTPTFTWYKSGSELYSIYNSGLLHLPSVSQEDAGSYSCAVKGQSYRSPAVTLNVHYLPKSVSVSISPSNEIVEGSSVTLTCSSDANPPVHDYTWYKGTTSIGTRRSYSINRISSEDSGEYKCKAGHGYGEKYSDGAALNVLYPPKRVSVSISPSGEIVEGSSVTLTCSSDANPPVQTYTWYKGTTSIGTGRSYIIHTFSSEDSGEYKCKASNRYGEKYSDGVTLDFLYPPKRVSVSISPSGEIVEGSSVTLTCSSDAKPPVHDYTWYKGTSSIGTGRSYSINRISSEDSGEYKCKARNQHGEKYSDGVTLNILYPPKRVSVSIRPSGEIVEGSSVTLTCSSDAKPPVQTYTWYKGTSSIGTGRSYIIHTISSEDSGEYKCKSSNQHGEKYSDGASLDVLYPPKRVSVSVSPSGEIVEGSSVTLTCSSNANPPVETYTWYKGTTSIRTGRSYIIHMISSEDSGEYKCKARNRYGEKYSDGATLNYLYPPKRVSVSIRPSGEIVEGSSVTLTCSSDANPPVETYTWYKGKSSIGTGKTYTINKISSEDSGEYKCKSRNRYGEEYSDGATLNVLYPPKRVSVSIRPSGEIVEGSSVTLTCSSDANPPVQTYTWYKGTTSIGTRQSYIIHTISSEDSGEYKCKARNRYGEKHSDKAAVNVLYPPKRVSVSISPSGEIVEGSAVTLTCSSDANPPVHDYTWYKVNESSPLGSGQSYSFTLSFNSSGWFYCVAQNKYGNQRAAAVPLTLNESPSLYHLMILCVAVGVSLCSIGAFIAGFFCKWEKMKKSNEVKPVYETHSTKHVYENDGARAEHGPYSALDPTTRSSNDVYCTLATISHR